MKKAKQNKSSLTQSDFNTIINNMKTVFPTREEMHKIVRVEVDSVEERLNQKINLLPTKEEFFSRMDKLSGEIKAMRDEHDLHAGQHRQINDRFEVIDKNLGISSAN